MSILMAGASPAIFWVVQIIIFYAWDEGNLALGA